MYVVGAGYDVTDVVACQDTNTQTRENASYAGVIPCLLDERVLLCTTGSSVE